MAVPKTTADGTFPVKKIYIYLSIYSQLESTILFTLQCFVYSLFHVRTASAIMVQHKRMRVLGYSMTIQHARQGRTLDYSPIE